MIQTPGWWLTVAAAMAGMAVGAFLCMWWTRRAARARKRIPRRWPLTPRVLANTEERKVWRWLRGAFSEYQIMIKIPVTRFTLPRSKEQGPHWYNLLSGVYCTLTVCAADGHVIGCVDVPGSGRISRSNRQLKQTLLSQCGIAYWVVESANLPTIPEIRCEFLGEVDATTHAHEQDEAMMATARIKLRASLDRQRQSRHSGLAPLTSSARHSSNSSPESHLPTDSGYNSHFGSGWQQQNSFVAPLDSRRGDLH